MTGPMDTFRMEAEEHLSALEDSLLEMEQTPNDPELIALAFRNAHHWRAGECLALTIYPDLRIIWKLPSTRCVAELSGHTGTDQCHA